MLTLDGESFTTGRAEYYDADPERASQQAAIYVQIVLPLGSGISVLALVDTGTPYCIFNRDIMEALGFTFDNDDKIDLSTRVGTVSGSVERMHITLAAEEGNSLDIDASVFVSDEWHHGHFLGYSGFLERLRFAVDPRTNSFHFGQGEEDQGT